MPRYTLNINGRDRKVSVDEDTPLLWVLRDELGLTGTKFGCGRGLCGSCTVHLNGESTRSCMSTVDYAEGNDITTIEGLSPDVTHFIQEAWIAEEVPQCGYCQSGQVMAAAALLERNPNPSDQDIDMGMKMNLCRCGTYQRIKKAIHRAADEMK
ncbi:MAG: (2Fe-2S)-binding protein [Candidatus Marinimicrobia bacterium]|nr:(2Fe-2S)-binding protein [Candidatus Neomarinimicrobiota bacterium]